MITDDGAGGFFCLFGTAGKPMKHREQVQRYTPYLVKKVAWFELANKSTAQKFTEMVLAYFRGADFSGRWVWFVNMRELERGLEVFTRLGELMGAELVQKEVKP